MLAINSCVFRFGDVTVREREFSVVRDGKVYPVEPKAFRVLLMLLRSPGRLISKDELLRSVWDDAVVTENSLTRNISLLRRLLNDDPREPRYIETVSTIGYRFLFPVEISEESGGKPEEAQGERSFGANGRPKESTNGKHTLDQAKSTNSREADSTTHSSPEGKVKGATNGHQALGSVEARHSWPMTSEVATTRRIAVSTRTWIMAAAGFVVLLAIGFGISKYRSRTASPANGPAPLYVAEFTNSVGDTSFDYVLRDIVALELSRSPAFEVVAASEDDLVDLLQKAGKGPDDSLTPELARELCERAKGRFFTGGKIEPEGAGYSLELSVRECKSGKTVAQQRVAARNRDEVMQVVSQLAVAIGLQLSGKSVSSSNSTPAPLPTASLAAYKAYLLGERIYQTQLKQSATMLRRAIELDPTYAKAWEDLSIADYKLNDQKRDDDDLSHAFALRGKLPENDRATVEARYHWEVTGEIYKAIEDLQTLEKLRPNEFPPRNLLALAYSDIGMYEKATVEFRRNRDLFPNKVLANSNLVVALSAQGRYDEAESVLRQAPDAQAIGIGDHAVRYQLAMLRSDQAAIEIERSWMEGNADDPMAISFLARIDLSEGRLEVARHRTQHAVNVSLQSGLSESAARMLLNLAQGEALYGQSFAARQALAEAMKLSDSKETKEGAVRVMALNGQERDAEKLMGHLLHEYPTDTFLTELDTPIIRAASQLVSGQFGVSLSTLDRAKPFEFGRRDALLSNYERALVYLRLRRPEDAIGEFNAILAHRGQSPLSPIIVTSQLGLAHAYAMRGDKAQRRAACEAFLAAWKNADSNLPILKEAHAEYSKLQ
jgi:eukaryotic-like serine/threonine-protein kinase